MDNLSERITMIVELKGYVNIDTASDINLYTSIYNAGNKLKHKRNRTSFYWDYISYTGDGFILVSNEVGEETLNKSIFNAVIDVWNMMNRIIKSYEGISFMYSLAHGTFANIGFEDGTYAYASSAIDKAMDAINHLRFSSHTTKIIYSEYLIPFINLCNERFVRYQEYDIQFQYNSDKSAWIGY